MDSKYLHGQPQVLSPITIHHSRISAVDETLESGERRQRAAGARYLVVDRDAERCCIGSESALALLQHRLAVGPQHQYEMGLAGVARLQAQRRLHQVVEYLGLGAANESRQVEVHHQSLRLAAAVNDVEDFLRDAPVVLL